LDEFFQKLREIQKKERSISGLSRVGDNFYTEVSNYLNGLMRKIDDNPFSFESYLLRDAQRIVAEICERREHKIANSAVMNVQRAYQLFKESKSKDSSDTQITVPINSTPEEEFLYLELVESIIKYRGKLTAPLMSYIQKNHGTIHAPVKEKNKPGASLKSLNIDDLLSEAPKESLNESEDYKEDISQDGFEDQIFERYGSEPARKDGDKTDKSKADDSVDIPDKTDKSKADGSVDIPDKTDSKQYNSEASTSGSETAIIDEKPGKNNTKTLMILDELPSIVGVDKNIYGPVSPQDLITIPEPNANILVKNKKGIFIQTYK
jgi:DNA replication factor GINS